MLAKRTGAVANWVTFASPGMSCTGGTFMLNKNKKKSYYYLVIVLLLILIGTGLVINWNNLLRITIKSQSYVTAGNTVAPYKIAVYYFPGQKHAAKALSYYFERSGYLVDLLPAKDVPRLNHKRNAPSHIFFKTEELAQAMDIKQSIEKIIGHPVSAYRFTSSQENFSMMVVFTNTT